MKVALVSFSVVTRGGTQRQMLSLAHELLKQGHLATIYTLDKGSNYGYQDLVRGLSIISLPGETGEPKSSRLPGILGGLSRKIRRKKLLRRVADQLANLIDKDTEVVNTHDDESYKVGFFFKKINSEAVLVWTMNDPPISYMSKGNILKDFLVKIFNFFELLYEKRFVNSVDQIAVLDGRNKSMASRYYGRPVSVIRSGLDFDKFYRPIKDKTSDEFVILAMGLGSPHRRFEDLVVAAEILNRKVRKFKVRIISHPVTGYINDVKSLSERLGIGNRVEIIASASGVTDAELVSRYQSSDIFVFPNDPQTWGLAVFEAMAAGGLAIVSKTAGASEVLTDGINAFIVPPRRPDIIAEKIDWLINNKSEFEKIRSRGQDFVKEFISWERYAKSMISIFKK